MKFILLLNLFCVLLTVKGDVVRTKVQSHPNYPGKCLINGLLVERYAELRYYATCHKIFCGDNSSVISYTCGEQKPPAGKKLGELIDPTAPFPECCNRTIVQIN